METIKKVFGHVKDVFNWCASWIETYPKTGAWIILALAVALIFK